MAEKKFKPTYIREWLKFCGFSQADLARAKNISTTWLSAVASGEKQYTQKILEQTVDFLREVVPDLQPSDLISVNPFEGDTTTIFDAVRRVPASERKSAHKMLQGLADKAPARFEASRPAAKPARGRKRAT